MMHKAEVGVKLPPGTGGHPEKATPFQKWKMQQFVWTSDTPAGTTLTCIHVQCIVAYVLWMCLQQCMKLYTLRTFVGVAVLPYVNTTT